MLSHETVIEEKITAHPHAESQQCCAGLRGSREVAQAGCPEWQRKGCPERAWPGSNCPAGPAPAQALGSPCWPGWAAPRLMTASPTGWQGPQKLTPGSPAHLHMHSHNELHLMNKSRHASVSHSNRLCNGLGCNTVLVQKRVCICARQSEQLWAHQQWTSGCLRQGCGGLTHCAHASQCGC